MSNRHQEMLDTLEKVNSLNAELAIQVSNIEHGIKPEPQIKKVMLEKAETLDSILLVAKKFNSDTGGGVLEGARQTLEDVRRVLGMAA